MIREDNKEIGQTTVFNYDTNGNILSKSVYDFTLGTLLEKMPLSVTPYSYRATIWRDQMTAFNGEKCEYDNIGNPTKYRNYVTQFKYGGRMMSFDSNSYTYDANGERVSKTVNGVETKFITASGKVVRSISNGTVTDFFYDNYGLSSIRHNGVNYFVRKNVLGDVTHIYDTSGNLQAQYVYDAWGNHRVLKADGTEDINLQSIGNINPIRYRGYYYDTETKLYYLKARYYDPEAGRFISADSTQFLEPNTVNRLNLYAYCGNNPVMNVDPTGTFVLTAIIVGAIVGAVVGATVGGVIAYNSAKNSGYTGASLIGWTALGVVGGGLVGAGIGALIGATAPAAGAAVGTGGAIGGSAAAISITGVQVAAGFAAVGVTGLTILFARTPKQGGYYGERWPGDHSPDHVHLRGNDTDIRIGKNGLPLEGEPPLSPQARKALKKLWGEFLKLFNRW